MTNDGRNHKYLDYVSNWNEICCVLWSIIMAAYTFNPSSDALYKLKLWFTTMTAPSSLTISLVYWGLTSPEQLSLSIHSLHQHGGVVVVTFISLLFSHDPFPFFAIITGWIFSASYCTYLYTIYRIYGFERDGAYAYATFENNEAAVIKLQLILTFGSQSVFFIILYGICRIKDACRQRRQKSNSPK